eukprot:scaffold5860_cov223-Amphora_coffeaeformis.AAC.7
MTGSDLTTIKHTASGASAAIHAVGATVISYKSANGRENLFCSSKAVTDGSKAIRGGIPICFPIFGPPRAAESTMPQHGFARLNKWKLESTYDEPHAAGAKYTLDWSHVTHGMGDNNPWSVRQAETDGTKCLLTYEVRITGVEMTSTLLIDNTGSSSFDFQALFHTYLAVDNKAAQDPTKTYVKGLGGYTIIDKVTGSKDHVQSYDDHVVLQGETDRVYLHPDEHPVVHANVHVGLERGAIRIEAAGQVAESPSTVSAVVWNPGPEKAAAMADFGNDEYEDMILLCYATRHPPPQWALGVLLWSLERCTFKLYARSFDI